MSGAGGPLSIDARPARLLPVLTLDRAAFLLAFLILLVPVTIDLMLDYWLVGLSGQAPIVMAAAAYALWANRPADVEPLPARDSNLLLILLAVTSILFVLTRSQEFTQGESLALMLIFPGLAISLGGRALYRKTLFFQFALLLALPLPVSVADGVLVPIKVLVSKIVCNILSLLGYPIAVSGVVITIGFSELMMADACSGLWSMVSLITLGVLYLYFLPLRRITSSAIFILMIPMIAIACNLVRLSSLVLLAYYGGLGTEAVAHDYAAFAELVLSLLFFNLLHRILELAESWSGRNVRSVTA